MKKAIFVLSLFAIVSCDQGISKKDTVETEIKKEDPNAPSAIPDAKPLLSSGCYRMVIKRDTAEMKINVNGNKVSGDLQYNPFEKDGSFGKFDGSISDGIIRAWYAFESEGMKSYREVMYKIEGNGFVEGFGDIEMKNDSVWFKYPQTLKFEHDHPFLKVDCK